MIDGLLGRFAYYCLFHPLLLLSRVLYSLSYYTYSLGRWFVGPWTVYLTPEEAKALMAELEKRNGKEG